MSVALVPAEGVLLGRAMVPGFLYPRVVTVRGGRVLDITGTGGADLARYLRTG